MQKKLNILVLILLLFVVSKSWSQLFPAQAIFNLSAPFPIYLSDYANPVGNNIGLKLLYRDSNIGSRNIRLKFSILGQSFQTANQESNASLPSFDLVAGVPLNLTQADLFPYFQPQNLDLSPSQYSAPLPEGVYRFGVEIIDSQTGRAISGVLTSQPYWLLINEPPLINLPQNSSVVQVTQPQNIVFQWTPRTKQAAAIEYEFTLTELFVPEGFEGNLQNIFNAQPPYYQHTTVNTTLLYGAGQPPLIEGRLYGFRIKAKAKKGLEEVGIFRNEGYSEVFTFRYGQYNADVDAVNNQSAKIFRIENADFLTGVYGKLISGSDSTNLLKAGGKVIQVPINQGDTVKLGNISLIAKTTEYFETELQLPKYGSKIVKFFFKDNLTINNKKEVSDQGLSIKATGNTLSYKSYNQNIGLEPTRLNNVSSILSNLILLEHSKNSVNDSYWAITNLAETNPAESNELKDKLQDYQNELKDRSILLQLIINDLNKFSLQKTLSNKLTDHKKEFDIKLEQLVNFNNAYSKYKKPDFSALILNAFVDAKGVIEAKLREKERELKQLETQIAEERILTTEQLKEQYGINKISTTTNSLSNLKNITENYEAEIKKMNKRLDEKFIKLKKEILAKYE